MGENCLRWLNSDLAATWKGQWLASSHLGAIGRVHSLSVYKLLIDSWIVTCSERFFITICPATKRLPAHHSLAKSSGLSSSHFTIHNHLLVYFLSPLRTPRPRPLARDVPLCLFSQHIFVECVLWAGHHSQGWWYKSEQYRESPTFIEFILEQGMKEENKQNIACEGMEKNKTDDRDTGCSVG